ncbi:hypothetical protein FOMPIDRAFT_1041463 [Fomitopsis schrenkii]|uniref:BTB domain-containing protein n=1 Tax=Fomitopsis schrenkii TaxID=2126942 RepID=S8FS89_FOMSC|nr:hypothetical protein FOMPIDRAFT_1041463 [Fomitopsis schrenkii]
MNHRQVTDAPAPFNKASADVILRSSDLVDFRVRKGILAEASSVFEDMFGIPQPEITPSQGDTREGLPVVKLEEDSDILQWLLRLCYPGNSPRIDDLDNLRPIIRAAIKYDIPEVLRTLKENLGSFAESMPVRVYAIALQFKFEAEAREAARAFLARPVESADVPELVEITGKDLHNLLKYHRACSVVAARVASDPSWVPQSEVWFATCRAHGTCARKHLGNVNASEWWINYMTGSARILEATPAGKALLVEGRTDAALRDAAECMVCKHPAPEQMRKFIRQFAGLVNAVTAQVSLDYER